MKYNVFIFLFLIGFYLNAQTKNERETRVDLEATPKNVQEIVLQIRENVRHIKYYQETDNENISFEVKFKFKGDRYSIEFSKYGSLEDIEVLIRERHLPEATLKAIKSHFDDHYDKVAFIKIQKQFVNHLEDAGLFVDKVLNKEATNNINYEIVAEVKNNSKRKIFEFLFNQNGQLIQLRELMPTSYEHELH